MIGHLPDSAAISPKRLRARCIDRRGTSTFETSMVMLFVVGMLLVVLEAITLTPVHHRIVESMNQELQHEIDEGHVDPALLTDQRVLTQYEIDASDAKILLAVDCNRPIRIAAD